MKALFRTKRRLLWLSAALVARLMVCLHLIPWRARVPVTVRGDETIQVGGMTRRYRLVIPDSVDGRTPAPLLFAFHGAMDTTEAAAR